MASGSESSLLHIRKLEGAHNFAIWQKLCYNVLLQKKHAKPIKEKGVKPESMSKEEWEEMDELARSTIMLSVSESLLFNLENIDSAWDMWQRLEDLYAQQSAASKVYWLKKLMDLRMKEGTSMSVHLNEFNSIFSQLTNQKFDIDDEFKATFLLCTLPESWDTFRTALSNSNAVLLFVDVESALLTEEMNRKNNAANKSNALNARGRSQQRGRSQDKEKSRSKSRSKKDIECYYCGKKGHMKKQCFKWKKDKKEGKEEASEQKGKSTVKIEELNSVTQGNASDDDVLFSSSLDVHTLLAGDTSDMKSWIIDSGASFHVTPYRECFAKYCGGRQGVVYLGNNYACEIAGVGDVLLMLSDGSRFMLKNVRHVPQIKKNLISTGLLDDDGFHTTFGDAKWKFTKGSMVIARGHKVDTLYPLFASDVCLSTDLFSAELPMVELWHGRLGHMSPKGMEVLSRSGYLPCLKIFRS